MTPRQLSHVLPPLLLSLLWAPALSQWSPTGTPLCQGGCPGDSPIMSPDGNGGAYVIWRDSRNYPVTDDDVYLQRVTGSGTIAPGWPPEGLPVCAATDYQAPYGIALDGQGGVLVVWIDYRDHATWPDVYAQRVLADGSLAPGWVFNGVPVSLAPRVQDYARIAPDGAGGAFVAWRDHRDYATNSTDIYAQHLTADGTVAAGWPAGGLPVCTDPAGQSLDSIVSDGAGGLVLVWGDTRRGVADVYAQHLLGDGSLAPGWVANGLPLMLDRAPRGVAADGAGGFYAGGATVNPPWDAGYFLQRFTFAGARAAGWPAGGLPVCAASGIRAGLVTISDGLGGALLAWYDYRPPPTGGEIYALRILSDGSLAPGWTLNGTRVSDATAPGSDYDPELAPDGSGGVYVAWGSQYNTEAAWVQHLTGNAGVASGWRPYGVQLAPSNSQFEPRIASDGRRGAIVAWDERCCGRLGMYAQRFVLDGPVAVAVALVSAEADPDRVALVWQAAEGAALSATVERRGASSDWTSLAAVTADGTGRIAYEDRSVQAGERYAYRLAYTEDGVDRRTAETWVEVPRALPLALEGLRPNPAVGELTVSFTLPSTAPATLALVDVSGRVILQREVGSLGAGHHLVRLEEGAQLAPGIYWLRLAQGGRALSARAVVVR